MLPLPEFSQLTFILLKHTTATFPALSAPGNQCGVSLYIHFLSMFSHSELVNTAERLNVLFYFLISWNLTSVFGNKIKSIVR